MKVMLFGRATSRTEASEPPTAEAMLAMHQFNEELEKAGVLLDLGGLKPSRQGVRVKFSGGRCTVTDGPFPESKELIAGYLLLEVKSLAEAVEWAKRMPLDPYDGEEPEVEIRPLFGPEDFDVPGEAEERAKRLGKE